MDACNGVVDSLGQEDNGAKQSGYIYSFILMPGFLGNSTIGISLLVYTTIINLHLFFKFGEQIFLYCVLVGMNFIVVNI